MVCGFNHVGCLINLSLLFTPIFRITTLITTTNSSVAHLLSPTATVASRPLQYTRAVNRLRTGENSLEYAPKLPAATVNVLGAGGSYCDRCGSTCKYYKRTHPFESSRPTEFPCTLAFECSLF